MLWSPWTTIRFLSNRILFPLSLIGGDKVTANVLVRVSYVTYTYMRVCDVRPREPVLPVSLLSLSLVTCKQKD
jgi:hypothetical protein